MDHPEHAPADLFKEGETEMSKAQAVAKVEPREPTAAITPMQMLQIAVEQNADLDKLTKLMDLQERWEANEAKKAFVSALNAFKKDPPEIIKNKHVEFDIRGGDKTEYYHATLDQVCDVVGAALSEHGLSHRWEVTQSDDPQNVKVTVACVLTHEKGHSERVSITALPDDSGKKNRIQQIGSTITYLQRYTLLAATGLAAGPDDDGAAAAERPWKGPLGKTELKTAARNLATAITEAATLDDLKAVQIDNMEVIEQMQDDLPEWYFGDGGDIKGAKAMIAERRAALERQEGTQR